MFAKRKRNTFYKIFYIWIVCEAKRYNGSMKRWYFAETKRNNENYTKTWYNREKLKKKLNRHTTISGYQNIVAITRRLQLTRIHHEYGSLSFSVCLFPSIVVIFSSRWYSRFWDVRQSSIFVLFCIRHSTNVPVTNVINNKITEKMEPHWICVLT